MKKSPEYVPDTTRDHPALAPAGCGGFSPHDRAPVRGQRKIDCRPGIRHESTKKEIFMVAQKSAHKDDPGEDEISIVVGTIGIIIQLLRLPDGTVKVLVEGKKRGVLSRNTSPVKNDEYFPRQGAGTRR